MFLKLLILLDDGRRHQCTGLGASPSSSSREPGRENRAGIQPQCVGPGAGAFRVHPRTGPTASGREPEPARDRVQPGSCPRAPGRGCHGSASAAAASRRPCRASAAALARHTGHDRPYQADMRHAVTRHAASTATTSSAAEAALARHAGHDPFSTMPHGLRYPRRPRGPRRQDPLRHRDGHGLLPVRDGARGWP